MMDVGDAAGDRVLDRDHAELGLAGSERAEAILEGGAGDRLVIRIGLAAGEMRIRARLALEDDLFLAHAPIRTRFTLFAWPGCPGHPLEGVRPKRDHRASPPMQV